MKHLLTLLFATLVYAQVSAQKLDDEEFVSPYKTSWGKDAVITGGGIGLTVLGYYLITQKEDLTLAGLATRTRDKVPFFDRGNVGYYSEKADKDSYKPFNVAFGYPILLMLVNKNERQKIGQITGLYLQTMSITGALFTLSAGAIHRSRPLVYAGSGASTDYKLSSNNQRSFFAGHTAATAAASFFAARVYNDFNPDSKTKYVVWAVAAATPALVGYLRYKAGMHFLSDNILGYAIGAATGILVPQLHKTKLMRNVSITPQAGLKYQGLAVDYNF
ncbi:MAG: phosphatase PAP2 family protein [Chitinophagaceae bacterium]|nr:phosphatase PAP2 family protein [Chitinophagaceae bacterium]